MKECSQTKLYRCDYHTLTRSMSASQPSMSVEERLERLELLGPKFGGAQTSVANSEENVSWS